MDEPNEKPFIPRDKPKSFVIGAIAGLIGFLVIGPLIFLGAWLELNLLKDVGVFLFWVFWAILMLSMLIFGSGMLGGKYKNIKESNWGDQVW
jgi:hypothetical protein